MAERLIYIKSSSGSFYNVRFNFDGSTGTFSCDCKAGIFGELCKHVKAFFEDNASLLFADNQFDSFQEVCLIVKDSYLYQDYAKMLADLKNIEIERKRLNAETTTIKRNFYNKIRICE